MATISSSQASPPKPLFALGLGGALGGLVGTFLGHVAVVGAFSLDPGAGAWFQGPHGSPFFSLMLSAGLMYAGVGAGVFRGARRFAGAALGFAVAALGVLMPMAVATRVFTWGEDPTQPATLAWFYLVLASYTGASSATLWLVGSLAQAGARTPDHRAGFGALAGGALGYAFGMALHAAIPALNASLPPGRLPHVGALVDGTLSGCLIGIAIAVSARRGTTPELRGSAVAREDAAKAAV